MHRLRITLTALTTAIGMTSADPAAAENVLRWASVGGALTFDPLGYDEVPTSAQVRQVYETLATNDANLNLVPVLATAWRLVDPTTWEFELRPNVRFHDGTPFKASDVVFSFRRAKADVPGKFAKYVESIADVQAVDEHTVRFETSLPDPQLLDQLRDICIMSAHWGEARDALVPANVSAGEENFASRHANGTGPFILKEFEPNGRIVMVRNPDWWGLKQYPHNIDRIEYTPITDPKGRIAALLEGDLDLLTDPPLSALEQIRNAPGLKLTEGAELRTIYLGLDQASQELRSSNVNDRNPFSDRRVRQAIYHAIDIEAIRADVMQRLSIPAGMMVPPRALGYALELDKRLPHDPEAAKALLAEAGYPEGFSVTLDCPNNRYINDEAICRAIAAQLGKVSLDVAVNAQPKDVIFAKVDNRETDFYLLGRGTYDSHDVFISHYRTGGAENASGYSNPKVDELIKKIDATMITYARDAMIEEVWKIVLDDIVYIPLHYQMIVWAMHDNLEIPVFPFNRPIFAEARFKTPKSK
jgi:peptide/nickel transport system substrate-binding protein